MSKVVRILVFLSHCLTLAGSIVNQYFVRRVYRSVNSINFIDSSNNWHSNRRWLIICNGPSLSEFDLKNIKSPNVVTMNKFSLSDQFLDISPIFHIVVDKKIIEEWPIEIISNVLYRSNAKIVIDARFLLTPRIKPLYEEFNQRFIPLDLVRIFTRFDIDCSLCRGLSFGGGAPVVGLFLARAAGSLEVGLIGKDGTGLLNQLLGMRSHFYGAEAIDDLSFEFLTDALVSNGLAFDRWKYILECMKNSGVAVYTLSNEGLFRALPYYDYEEFVR